MNRRALVIGIGLVAVAAFGGGAFYYTQSQPPPPPPPSEPTTVIGLERFHSPVLGPMNAPVTIVEFFDPSCEACRAYYPYVKQIMDANPDKVRLVLRYTPFHPASEEAVRVLEASRKQNLFVPVLEALLQRQGEWGADGSPNPEAAWAVAASVGLDVVQGRTDGQSDATTAIIAQDRADVEQFGVNRTPTFYVNGNLIAEPSPELLDAAVDAALPQG